MVGRAKEKSLTELQPVARVSLSDKIVEQILDLIARDVLKPGDRLPPERELCKQFGVGRTSLREALRSLAVMGILDGRIGEGTFVCRDNQRYLEKTLRRGLLLDRKTVRDLTETRLMLEEQNAFWAAQRATTADRAAIEATLEGMAATVQAPEDYLEHDLQFHLVIARATQNTILHTLLTTTRSYLHEWIKGSLAEASTERAELSLRQHRAISAALFAGEAAAAQEAMRAHILSSSVDLASHVSLGEKGAPG